MADDVTLKLLILAKAEQAIEALRGTGKSAEEAGGKASKSSKGFGDLKTAIGGLAAIEAVKKVAELGGELIDAGEKANQSDARIKSIATSMGVFGNRAGEVTERLAALADKTAIQDGLDANTVKMTEAKLLTFKSLASSADQVGGAFDRANRLALDLAAAGFGSATTNAAQLGRALEDPAKGLTALRRVGIIFTAQQTEQIKAMVKSGHTAEAQKVILDALDKKVGGTAEHTATSTGKMRAAWDVIKEKVGQELLPAFEKFTGFVTEKVVPAVLKFVDGMQKGTGPGGKFKEAVEGATKAVSELVGFIDRNSSWIVPLAAGILSVAAALKTMSIVAETVKGVEEAWTIVQKVLNTALKDNPIGVVITVLSLLVVGLIYAYDHSKAFRDIVNSAFRAVGEAATWMWNNAIGPALRFIVNGIGDIIDMYANLLGALGRIPSFGWAKKAADDLHAAAQKTHELADGIKNIPNRTVSVNVNFSSNAWQIQQQVASAARLAAGISFGSTGTAAGSLQARASGGPVDLGSAYLVGEEGPELFVPSSAGTIVPHAQTRSAMDGGGNVYITVQGDTDPLGAARRITQQLIQYKRTLGGRTLGIA